MSKIDFFGIPIDTPEPITVVIQPPRGEPCSLAFLPLESVDQFLVQDEADKLIQRHISGRGRPGKPGYRPPEPCSPVGGRELVLTETKARAASLLWAAQVERVYTPIELAAALSHDWFAEQLAVQAPSLLGLEAPSEESEPAGN